MADAPDPEAMARKRAEMDQRMATRRRELELQREARRDGADKSTRELVLAFEEAFSAGLKAVDSAVRNTTTVDEVDAAAKTVQELHQSVAEASTYLPSQTLERSTRSLVDLEAAVRAQREILVPKKKFAFKARAKVAGSAAATAAVATAAPPAAAAHTTAHVVVPPAAKARDVPPALPPEAGLGSGAEGETLLGAEVKGGAAPVMEGVPGDEGAEVRGLCGECLRVEPPRGSGGDLALTDLVDCDVELCDGVAAVWVSGLVRCRLVSLPIAGAAHITACEGCTFVLASRQIRIHHTTASDFYLHCGSHPIIEECTALRFAPYSKAGDVSDEALAAAGLSRRENLWDRVNDFNWLRTQQSPNWTVLPEAERVPHSAAWPHCTAVAVDGRQAVDGGGDGSRGSGGT